MHKRELYEELDSSNVGLARALDQICSEADAIWEQQNLREFTVHGGEHYRQVESNLDCLTNRLQRSTNKLSPEEIFVLLSACYLHDIGMQLGVADARQKHAQYSYDLILRSSPNTRSQEPRVTLSIPNPNARAAVAKVARAHWTNYALELLEEDFIYENERGRIKLLGLLLSNADLLDTSAIRASYFRSNHRLFELKPVAELHQTMHELVCGYQIKPADGHVLEKLVFELQWRDRSNLVRHLSEWQIRWFSSQIRQLAPELERLSRGAIRWETPWAKICFRDPEGPMPTLSDKSQCVLQSELASQRLINREAFIQQFHSALEGPFPTLFWMQQAAHSDARQLSDWCWAQARNTEGLLTARIDIPATLPVDTISVITQLFEQWNRPFDRTDESSAIEQLGKYLHSNSKQGFFLLLIFDIYNHRLHAPILESALRPIETAGVTNGHVCLVITLSASKPPNIEGANLRQIELSPFLAQDVDDHLAKRHGLHERERSQMIANMEHLGLFASPAAVYTYLEDHCYHTAWEELTQQ